VIAREKILIVKLGSIGDVVNTLPLVNVLKDSGRVKELAWLIEPKSYPLLEGHSSVDRFLLFRRTAGLAGVKRALGEIRYFRPDMVIDLQRILRSSFFTFFSGCPRRLGFDRRRSKEFSWLFTNMKIPPADPVRHMVLQYLEFATYLGIEWSELKFVIPVKRLHREEAKKLLPAKALTDGFFALNIGASKPANRWPREHWKALVRLLLGRTARSVILTGGRDDLVRAEFISGEFAAEARFKNLVGRTTLKQLGGLFSLSETVVSADSGPMHIASALGTRTIGLFGPADPRRTGPFNHPHLNLCAREDCSPCRENESCMREISPEAVYDRILSLA